MRKKLTAMWRVALKVACRRIFGSELRPFFKSALSRMIPTPGPLSGLLYKEHQHFPSRAEWSSQPLTKPA